MNNEQYKGDLVDLEMSKNKVKGLASVILVGALALSVVACSDSDKDKNEDSSMKKTESTMKKDTSMKKDEGVMVGGSLMVKDKDIVDNAANADNVTTLVSLVKLAGLVDTLKGEGPFTVFAPNNDAFAKIDAATVESLQKPENIETLKSILTYHVVAGSYKAADLVAMAKNGEKLKTVQGGEITLELDGDSLILKDAKGGEVEVETPDVISSNGVTHVVKSVLMPA